MESCESYYFAAAFLASFFDVIIKTSDTKLSWEAGSIPATQHGLHVSSTAHAQAS